MPSLSIASRTRGSQSASSSASARRRSGVVSLALTGVAAELGDAGPAASQDAHSSSTPIALGVRLAVRRLPVEVAAVADRGCDVPQRHAAVGRRARRRPGRRAGSDGGRAGASRGGSGSRPTSSRKRSSWRSTSRRDGRGVVEGDDLVDRRPRRRRGRPTRPRSTCRPTLRLRVAAGVGGRLARRRASRTIRLALVTMPCSWASMMPALTPG